MNKVTYLILPVIAITAGCVTGTNGGSLTLDPNAVSGVIDTVGAVAVAVGGPVAGVALIGTNILSAAWGNWQRNKKKKSETKYDTLEKITTTVVETIDEVSELTMSDNSTLGDTVKSKIKSKLEGSNTYESGKKVIAAIKEGIQNGKNYS